MVRPRGPVSANVSAEATGHPPDQAFYGPQDLDDARPRVWRRPRWGIFAFLALAVLGALVVEARLENSVGLGPGAVPANVGGALSGAESVRR